MSKDTCICWIGLSKPILMSSAFLLEVDLVLWLAARMRWLVVEIRWLIRIWAVRWCT